MNEMLAGLMRALVMERDGALSVMDNSDNPLVQDFAFIDAQACNQKIAKLQEIARAEELRCI